jgi:hypothetical protein
MHLMQHYLIKAELCVDARGHRSGLHERTP